MFRYVIPILLVFLGLACGTNEKVPTADNNKSEAGLVETHDMFIESDLEIAPQYSLNEQWICHHPGTDMHNEVCIEDEFPNGCYIKGETRVFCWLLLKNDCDNPSGIEPWAHDVCHHLR